MYYCFNLDVTLNNIHFWIENCEVNLTIFCRRTEVNLTIFWLLFSVYQKLSQKGNFPNSERVYHVCVLCVEMIIMTLHA